MKQMKHSQLLLSLSIALVMTGCANINGYNNSVNIASSHHILSEEEVNKNYHIDSSWWSVYNDNQLNALVEQAINNNIDLKQAAINVNKALFQANILGANLVPSFNGSLGASRSKELKSESSGQSNFSSQLGLSYELDLWHKLSSQTDAQIWAYQASHEDLASARLTLINNTIDAYFYIAYLNQAINLANNSIKIYENNFKIAEAQYHYGKVDESVPRQFKQSLLSEKDRLITLQSNRAETITTLRNILNLKPNEQFSINTNAFKMPSYANIDNFNLNIPLSALANRPDLRAADYRIQSALSSVEAQRRSWYPSITIGASLSTASNSAKTMFDVPLLAGSIRINLPFLDWPTLKWQSKIEEENYNSAKLNFEQTLTKALNEVSNNYFQYQNAISKYNHAKTRYDLAIKNSRYYKVRYENGKNELKDYLDAQNNENDLSQSLSNQAYEVIRYEMMLYKSMAGKYLPIKN